MRTRKYLRAVAKGTCTQCGKGIVWSTVAWDATPGGAALNPMKITTKCAKCKKGGFQRNMTEAEVEEAKEIIKRIDKKRKVNII